MEHLPINIDLRGRKVIVTGGITGSARKVGLALRAGANVEVYAMTLGPVFMSWSKPGPHSYQGAPVQGTHARGRIGFCRL